MRSILKYFNLLFIALFIISCSSDDSVDIDEQKPTISINYNEGFPQACEQLVRGETYTFKAQVSDNLALASYSLDLHHNFDHHTHDDQDVYCETEPIKAAVNPFIYMESFSIENAPTSYEINIVITIPNDIDTGDYHCAYSVTDETGWQSRTSIDIKII
ncbi:DUF4625 domain-containing protein [Winogradskyella sp. F6397]|uniref:DUF4625 domain-containing protein n=1 Tax=Winogradskyella marina TaxID=2785530 RepID=A0ABS0EJW3_9FLAO|nr:DUF4625 domain-containing protein [Winogradskyella marina]MBF8150755.1 DUF4625 domain-containing protein [Winogradskyella marina]